jgi:hypothetical protein
MREAISNPTAFRRLLLAFLFLTDRRVSRDFITEGLAAVGSSPTSLTPQVAA